jgi:DNA-binding PucR family transcriptional regulator
LDTLEAFLDNRGNAVRTSRLLYIHANTLRQRLQRIERVAGIDLEREDWLSLAIAVKVVKLRRMKNAVNEGGREDGS